MEIFENIQLFFKQINQRTEQAIARVMFSKSMTVSVAESCTGGLISSRLTDIAGSSVYIKENYVTYANEAKVKILGVNPETLEKYGAVSEECAFEMVSGLFDKTGCDISLAITGIAGPGGASLNKNVGLVFIAIKNKYSTKVKRIELNPNYKRKTMKFMFSQAALEFLLEFLKDIDARANQIKTAEKTEFITEETNVLEEEIVQYENEDEEELQEDVEVDDNVEEDIEEE